VRLLHLQRGRRHVDGESSQDDGSLISVSLAAACGFNLLGGFLMETLDDFLRGTFHLLVESFHSDLLSGSAAGSLSLRLLRLRFGLWQGKGYRLSSEAVKER